MRHQKRTELEYVICNLCGNRNGNVIGEFRSRDLVDINRSLTKLGKRPILNSNHTFQVFRCRSCGLAFINPRMSRTALKRFYEGFYEGLFVGKSVSYEQSVYAVLNHEQEKGRLKDVSRFTRAGKLLDIGAGPGHFLSVAKKHGWQIYGHEYSKKAAAIAQQLLGQMLFTEKISQIPLPDNFLDVITMHSVLEHTSDPQEYVTTALKKLKPGGLLVVSVPNLRSLNYFLAKLFSLPHPGFLFEHLYYFSPKVISSLLKDFKILEMTSYNHSRPMLPQQSQHRISVNRNQSRFATFLLELSRKERKWLYIRNRVYAAQMRLFREFLEYHKIGGRLKLGDVLYVFAQKPAEESQN
ncbi:MAG: hypothetical protein A2785_02415 [Candidatus Chisholmbacteria bacterium RIFCSPHIGHO2_01_FULL_49_18]|uniref:Methyltransferase type 11 domain-containing protein n=2 Tax=Candidatus Chisholmiibacteriota TaxID=1817900 RepID=A0A1G1VNJ0_9BACT|nr:MAG: hypothetical protein A2785_02415 [Candidatus Chisholmbacteria bacterium RIFCSPHIGHO2_01_FULL_49_18]OGY21570.1 MAG: hypothetical protein A3A65_05630 [Candidatus Chisholmbacteria bacterium RIFCSPLOWO2_01_FULL_49_14]